MFGSPAQSYASSVSAWILRYTIYYTTFMGINWFGISHNPDKNCLVAKSRLRMKWFSLLIRILLCSCFSYIIIITIAKQDNLNVILLMWMHLFSHLIFHIIIFILQFCYEHKILHVINGFLRVFNSVNTLTHHDGIFDGKRVLSLLICNGFSLVFGFCGSLPKIFHDFSINTIVSVICDTYISVNSIMIFHISCVAYLSVTTLYDQLNSYVRHDFQREIRDLGEKPSPRQLKAIRTRLNTCLTNYDEIFKLAMLMQRFLELPLVLFLFFGFFKISLLTLYIILVKTQVVSMTLFVIKNGADILILTLSIDRARRSSRIMRRLSLENYYVGEDKYWHSKLETFLSRLNYNDFHVCPFGLFEISNEQIVVLTSALITYLTYIIQYVVQSNEI